MTRRDIACQLAKNNGLTVDEAVRMVNKVFDIMSKALIAGESIEIRGLGSFSVVEPKARMLRDFVAGETKMMEPAKKVRFRLSGYIKENLKRLSTKKA